MVSAAAPSATFTRCKRCATILRKARTVCPCCGLDVNAPPEVEPAPAASGANRAAASGATAVHADGSAQKKSPRPATAKSGVKICPICMATVPEAEMQEFQGKRVCPGCAERMQKTGAGAAPAVEHKPEGGSGSGGGSKMSIEAAASATSDLKSYAHLEEKLKKRLFRTKLVLIIFGVIFMVFGGLTALGGGLLSVGAEAMNSKGFEERMERDEQFKKLSPEEKEERLEKARDLVAGAAFKVKVIGMLLLGIGVFFVVTFFFVNTYPFQASLIALVLYVGIKLYDLSQGYYPGVIRCVIIASILFSLIDGILAGKQIDKLRAEKLASRRKPLAPAK